MPRQQSAIPKEIYRIKVTLLGASPPIWRRLLIPASMTLEDLHHVLQLAMEWDGDHMHGFRIGRKRYRTPDQDVSLMGLADDANECTAQLFRVLGKVGAKAVYTYDFGDCWQHGIVVEKVLPPDPEQAYPECLAGKRHAPPDDCGGVPSFYQLLQAAGNPRHVQYHEMRNWLGEGFDAEAFSVDEVNCRLAHLQRR